MNKLEHGLKVLKGRVAKRTPLKIAYICTLKCNFRCTYCGVWKKDPYVLNTKEVKRMMDQYKEMGTTAWSFTGGEPLLRGDIEELVLYSKKLGFLTTMVTNGALIKLKPSVIKELDGLVVSIDGIKTNDKYRGSTETILSNIKFAKDLGVDVTIQSVLTNENIANDGEDIISLFNFAKENKCKFIAQPLYSDDFNKKQSFDIERGIGILYKLRRLDPQTAYYTQSELTWMEHYNDIDRKCYAGRYFITILPNGSVVPCTLLWTDKHDMSKPVTNHVKEFFNSPIAKQGCSCCLGCSMKFNSLFSFKLDALMRL